VNKLSGLIKNVITFGASGRIDKKTEEFEDLHRSYERLYSEMEERRDQTNTVLQNVVDIKVKSIKSLKRINNISKNLKSKDREVLYSKLGKDYEKVDFGGIEETISAGEAAMNATKGVSTGLSTALGAWALVSTVGAASTGTAIAGLSGVAATNATLAWFGGGAIAAGGGGMAAGTLVLGGLVAIPALALTGIFSHISANKKIKEIEEKMLLIIKSTDQIENNILKLELLTSRSEELLISLEKSIQVFDIEYKKVYKRIYPLGGFSKLYKLFRKNFLRRNYFSNDDTKEIAYLGGLASDFAVLIDTKVIE